MGFIIEQVFDKINATRHKMCYWGFTSPNEDNICKKLGGGVLTYVSKWIVCKNITCTVVYFKYLYQYVLASYEDKAAIKHIDSIYIWNPLVSFYTRISHQLFFFFFFFFFFFNLNPIILVNSTHHKFQP
jgi:hypothetical protein